MRAWLLLLVLVICTAAFAESDADDNTARDNTRTYSLYDDVEMVSTLKFEYGKPRIVIKSVYPQLQSQSINDHLDLFNQQVLGLVDEKITDFKMHVAENEETQKQLPKSQLKNDLYIDYAASYIQSSKNPILSIRFSTQGYIAGMAHPYHHHFSLNYDIDHDKLIELADLFLDDADYLSALSRYTSERLNTRLRDKQMIAQGTAPTADNFKNWNIKPSGLLITFDEYQVAPYVEGTQTVLVPFSVLKELLNPESPIAGCLKHKRQCSNNNVLTGGFIDEIALNAAPIDTRHRPLNPMLSEL